MFVPRNWPALFGMFALLLTGALAWSRPPLPPPRGHELRGPALKKGLKLTIKMTATVKDADLEIDPGGGAAKSSFKVSTTQVSDREVELQAVTGRQPTVVLTRVVKEEDTSDVGGQGKPTGTTIKSPLAGQRIRSTLENKRWKHALEQGEATPEQKQRFDRFGPWAPEDGLFPPRRVRVGETWDINTKDLTTFPGGGAKMKGFSAKGKAKFRTIEKVQGETCAVVDYTLALKGTQEESGINMSIEATVKMTQYRSLKHGITLKMTAETAMKATADKLNTKMTGTQKTEVVTTVKE